MISAVWNFLKRHRRKFVFSGVIFGGGWLLWKYARKKFEEFQEKEAAECLSFARKQHHFDNNQRTCNMTALSMVPSLRECILKLHDSEILTQQLKSSPANKLEIWNELKILSFARTIVSVYTCCMTVVFLRVQLNIIGGYMYIDTLLNRNDITPEPAVATPKIQHEYLDAVRYILDTGLHDISEAVSVALRDVLSGISLKQQLSLRDIQVILDNVRKELETNRQCTNGYNDAQTSSLCRFMMPPHSDLEEVLNNQKILCVQKLMHETRDILESSDCQLVLTMCLDTGFAYLLDKLADNFRPPVQENGHIVNPNRMTMPLAKVIPIMNGMIHSLLANPPNQFIQDLLLKEQVKDFAANVYEAFSQADDEQHH